MEPRRNLFTIGQAAEYLGVSIDTLRRWEKKGRIEAFRSPGGHRYYERDDLDKLFGKRYVHEEKPEPMHEEPVDTVTRVVVEEVTIPTPVLEPIAPPPPPVPPEPPQEEIRDIKIPEVTPIQVAQRVQPSVSEPPVQPFQENIAVISQPSHPLVSPTFSPQPVSLQPQVQRQESNFLVPQLSLERENIKRDVPLEKSKEKA